MDRLTSHGEAGADNKQFNFIRNAATLNSISKEQLRCYYNVIYDRLAAYKGTGLAPEEINGMVFDDALDIKFGVPIDRLRELASADKDGRVVVLPCKVGDAGYVAYEGKIYEGKLTCVKAVMEKGCLTFWGELEFEMPDPFYCEKKTIRHAIHGVIGEKYGSNYLIQLSREEAEAALAKEERHG